jgi:hypothetical protein|tara:strand:+ start:338 stop:547 length:210 start_codon:yes stop_codon:yes gene_type:complete
MINVNLPGSPGSPELALGLKCHSGFSPRPHGLLAEFHEASNQEFKNIVELLCSRAKFAREWNVRYVLAT